MKISILLVLLLLVPLACYGQDLDSQTQAFMQIEVRDSKGMLTAYVEGKPETFVADRVIKFIELSSQKSIIVQDGKMLEKRQVVWTEEYSKAHVMAEYYIKVPINGQDVNVLDFFHDGYPVFPGDSAKIFLTILKPFP